MLIIIHTDQIHHQLQHRRQQLQLPPQRARVKSDWISILTIRFENVFNHLRSIHSKIICFRLQRQILVQVEASVGMLVSSQQTLLSQQMWNMLMSQFQKLLEEDLQYCSVFTVDISRSLTNNHSGSSTFILYSTYVI